MYDSLGEDVDGLKSAIQKEVSTGVIRGASYGEIAKRIEKRMVGDYKKFNGGTYAKAARIARTEGHRVQNTAAYDAQKAAQSKGANIVKQWDATLDARTRDSHAKVDGELTAVDEKFSNGLISANGLTAAQRAACDTNHDGVINADDAKLIEKAGILLNNINQNAAQEELNANSAYIEYCGMIDQMVEPVEITPDSDPIANAQPEPQTTVQSILGWFRMVFTIVLNWLLRIS